ncbi:MAG TPA: twin-arginine translocase TatA/TatE family subunit [Verrucomicrobiota bacterium]|nr:twin-arginine translocase TatA/TatE family subunit [Verrucomicrobiota bacterium]
MQIIAVPPALAMIGMPEILIIAVVVVLLFGARKIPDLFKGVGTGIKEFKKASKDDEPPGPR